MTVDWTRSTYCTGGNCAEVADTGTAVLLRDSKAPHQPATAFSYDQWREFTAAVQRGEFDNL